MGATDQMLARYVAEIEERQQFIDSLVESADGGDLSDEKLELVTEARNRISKVNDLMAPLEEARRISGDSAARIEQLARFMSGKPDRPTEVEYRSAGAYILDYWRAGLGADEAIRRLEVFNRAAAHQTTGDNPGLLPEQILGPVLSYVDAARPLVTALGPRQLPSGSFSRPKITQHTSVAAQSAEKAELVSQKMTIGKVAVTPKTFGGYVNISRQDIDWTQPAIMDIVVNDLAAQYAIITENEAVDTFVTAAPAGPTLPTGTPTADQVAGALWGAAALVMAATAGQGRVIAVAPPQMMGVIGPLFKDVNPTNAASTGFNTGALQSGLVGSVAGIPIYVSSAVADNNILVLSTAAAEVYEDRIGSLQVVEPSVLGVQVAYAGYFAEVVLVTAGLAKIVKTP